MWSSKPNKEENVYLFLKDIKIKPETLTYIIIFLYGMTQPHKDANFPQVDLLS